MTQTHQAPRAGELLAAISSLDLSSPLHPMSFESKLAAMNCWTLGFADRVTGEYRRFLYLTQVSARPVSPSDAVDQAWHLHLMQTENYWTGMCNGLLGRPLHHVPSAGGSASYKNDLAQYAATLETYAQEFGQQAPPDIWPAPVARFTPDNDRVLISAAKLGATTPGMVSSSAALRRVSVVFVVTMVVLLFASQPAFTMPASTLSWAYFFALLFAWAVSVIDWGGTSSEDLDPYEVAWLVGNTRQVGATALARLVQLGLVRFTVTAKGENGVATCQRIEGMSQHAADLHPCERAALGAIRDEPTGAADFFGFPQLLVEAQQISNRLQRAGLANTAGYIEIRRELMACALAALLALGTCRFLLNNALDDGFVPLAICLFLPSTILLMRALLASTEGAAEMGKRSLNAIRTQNSGKLAGFEANQNLAEVFALRGSSVVMGDRRFYGINYFISAGPPSNTGHTDDALGCGNNAPRCGA